MKIINIIAIACCAMSPAAWSQDMPTLPGKNLQPVTQEQIQSLVTVCEGCHGKGGHSVREEVPVIAGKPADEIVAALEAFYYYERHCPSVEYPREDGVREIRSMCDITNQLNQQEALAVAQYFEAAGDETQ